MQKTLVINAVGLTSRLIGAHTPRLAEFARRGRLATAGAVLPAVTCTVQSTYLTGAWPGGESGHGIVANGWYFRDECEIKFWKQSNRLVGRPKIWEAARQRNPGFTCANICWWYAMYSTADYTVTPRPMYPADGRKLPDCWTHPPQLRDELQRELGQFPLFKFWGPATDITATRWIADAAIRIDQKFNPTLTLVYLPHLDYVLQREGPTLDASIAPTIHPQAGVERSATPDAARKSPPPRSNLPDHLRELDTVIGKLLDHFNPQHTRVIILSEYGIAPVSKPIHLNRILREHNLLTIRDERGRDALDLGASAAFAVADHQLAHVYVNDVKRLDEVKRLLQNAAGVARVLDEPGKRELHLDHPRSGELVCLADPDAWFTYYYWLDDARAPDYARTVDIHRKPGYDPAELFIDPSITNPRAKIALTLARRKLGFRALLEITPLDATLVKGSHGLAPSDSADGAVLVSNHPELLPADQVQATDVFDVILRHLQP